MSAVWGDARDACEHVTSAEIYGLLSWPLGDEMSDLGVSFSPFNQPQKGQAPAGQTAPVQDAIKIMSLRMPTVAGASAAAPQALLGGPTAQGGQLGSANGGLLQAFLRRLLLGGQPTAGVNPPAPPQGLGAPPMPTSGLAPGGGAGLPVGVSFGTGSTPPTGAPPSPPTGNAMGTTPPDVFTRNDSPTAY